MLSKIVFIPALALLCGCYSHKEYTFSPVLLSGPGWTSFNGQAVWKPAPQIPELTGDVFLAVNTNGNAFLQFSKTLPFLNAQMDASHWQVTIPGQKLNYSGDYPLPTHFAWLQLPALLNHQPLTPPWALTGALDNWEISNPDTGESLRGYLSLP